MKADVKFVVLVSVGVLVAGLILNYGRDVKLLNDAHQGFDYTG